MVKKATFTVILTLFVMQFTSAQEFGLSFTYFFPRNGDFSVPVTPFSFRGVGVDFNKFSGIETGGTFYRMSGLAMTNLPFESKEALIGPSFTIMVPLLLVLKAETSSSIFKIKGGGFGFFNFAQQVNEGKFDRAYGEYLELAVLNSNVQTFNSIGPGWMVSAEWIVYFTKEFGINVEVGYLAGKAVQPLKGTYIGADEQGNLVEDSFDFPKAELDFTGWEISFGVLFATK